MVLGDCRIQENLPNYISSFIGEGPDFELSKCMLCNNPILRNEKMISKAFPDEIPEDVIFSSYEENVKWDNV